MFWLKVIALLASFMLKFCVFCIDDYIKVKLKMRITDNLLIRDPYLQSDVKPNRSHSALRVGEVSNFKDPQDDIRRRITTYQKGFHLMEPKIEPNNVDHISIAKKLLHYNKVNSEYHEAIKVRNIHLNNALNDIALDRDLAHSSQNQYQYAFIQQKNTLLRKIEDQSNQILHLKKALAMTMEGKDHLEGQLSHLRFVMDNQNCKTVLDLRQQVIRSQNMERTYKNLLNTKDEQIGQLSNRLRIYEDENKRLNQLNSFLQTTKNQNRIDNLSHINNISSNVKAINKQNQNVQPQIHADSQTKPYKMFQSNSKQPRKQSNNKIYNQKDNNYNYQGKNQNLNNHHLAEDILQKDEQDLENRQTNHNFRKANNQGMQINNHLNTHNQKQHQNSNEQTLKIEGLLHSIATLRNGINKEIFDVFFKSVREGEKTRQNSLVIFITNWKNLDIERLIPYTLSYQLSRDSLKSVPSDSVHPNLYGRLEQILPIHVSSRKGRTKINEWILKTIQFTKNQRESSKNSLNNILLFLFRLLTIQYRITYPMQGKTFSVDQDVKNQLFHEIVKAVSLIIQFK